MSSKRVGIEDARKRLGDLVTAAQQGTEIILTRNGKPAARIVSYQEDTMVTSQESAQLPANWPPLDGDVWTDRDGARWVAQTFEVNDEVLRGLHQIDGNTRATPDRVLETAAPLMLTEKGWERSRNERAGHPSDGQPGHQVFSQESPSTPIADGGYVYDPEADGADFRGFSEEELRALADERGLDFSAHPAIVTTEQVRVARTALIAVLDEVNALEREYAAAGRVVDQYVDSKDPEELARAEAAFADQERMREQGRQLAQKRDAAQQRFTEAEIAWFAEAQPDV